MSQLKIQQASKSSNLNRISSDVIQLSQKVKVNSSKQPQWTRLISIKLSERSQRYAVNYQGKRIGIIRPGLGCWIAEAQLQYGAGDNKLENESLAKNWLLKNYLKVHNSGIKFEVSENYCHYTIEKGYWLIKIDETPEDYIATIQDCNDLKYAYFPDLRSAIVCSFDLILNPTPINSNSSYGEF